MHRDTFAGNELIPLLDNEDSVCGIQYNGSAFYFLKNQQGDVIALTDGYGNPLARYTYDAWGKLLSVTDKNGNAITSAEHIAHINPYRYRGYYYDREIGMYYLQSRYYDPEVGRFVNGDDVDCVCVVLPSLAPTFMSAAAALSAKGKALVSICTAILNGLRYLPA